MSSNTRFEPGRGVEITDGVVKKAYKDSEEAMKTFSLYSSMPRPNHMEVNDNILSYEFVEGHHPKSKDDLKLVLDALSTMHTNQAPNSINMLRYCSYVVHKLGSLDIGYSKQFQITKKLHRLLESFDHSQRSCFIHGDCTVENIVITSAGQVSQKAVFIDPGNSRGGSHPANDYAKLVQSIRGWNEVDFTIEDLNLCPGIVNQVEFFYGTHLIRLLNHQHSYERIVWARNELETWLYLGVVK